MYTDFEIVVGYGVEEFLVVVDCKYEVGHEVDKR